VRSHHQERIRRQIVALTTEIIKEETEHGHCLRG
jgi:hypothetical protein